MSEDRGQDSSIQRAAQNIWRRPELWLLFWPNSRKPRRLSPRFWPKLFIKISQTKKRARILKIIRKSTRNLSRKIAALGLKARAAAGIKVRQPLQKLRILNLKLRIKKELIELLKDELNIKEVESAKKLPEGPGWLIETDGRISVALNTELTAELKEEGLIRELVRNIQEMRRDA